MTHENISEKIKTFRNNFDLIEQEMRTVLVGMDEGIRGTLTAIFAGGHALLEGVPGLGKTSLIRSVATTLGLSFKRIQFTPDLMPSDITGTQVLTEDAQGKRVFQFKPGPLFAHIVLADEINRATPKTQAALLEAMEERQVTVLGETHRLMQPFFVLATQNPVELEGTYPLPEAQLDRFMLKLHIQSPSSTELKEIIQRTTGDVVPQPRRILDETSCIEMISHMRLLVRQVAVSEPMKEVLVRLLSALSPTHEHATKNVKEYVKFGPGPRGAQSIILAAKVQALLDNRINLAFEDIRAVFIQALRHRLILNFQAEAESVTADDILEEVKNAK